MRLVTYCGVTKSQSEWAEFFGVTRAAVSARMRLYGETAEEAVRYFATRVSSGPRAGEMRRRSAVRGMSARGLMCAVLDEIRALRRTVELQSGKESGTLSDR